MRAVWTERTDRAGWQIRYTTIGGLAAPEALDELPDDWHELATRAISQAFIAATPPSSEPAPDVAYWASVTRKIIQRGTNPVIAHRALDELEGRPESPHELMSAVIGPTTSFLLDPSFKLHDVHELPFWRSIVEGDPRLTRWITPQAPLEVLAGRSNEPTTRWVDFLVAFPWHPTPVVVEIDGTGHERQPGVDRVRDELLGQAQIHVDRIPGRAVHDGTSDRVASLFTAIPPWVQDPDPTLVRNVHSAAATNRLAYAIVEAVERGFLVATDEWSIDLSDQIGLVKGLETVALDLLASINDAWNLDVVPHSITINGTRWRRDASGRFQRAGAMGPDASVTIRLEPFTPPHAVLGSAAEHEIVVRGSYLPVDLAWDTQSAPERRNRVATERSDAALDRLLEDIYGYEEFREGQKPAISRVLSGGDACVLLPTGAGKSLIYQLAGLLRPGVTLIVAPLKSLIDDQVRRLEDSGIDRVTGLHSGSTRSARNESGDPGGHRQRGVALRARCARASADRGVPSPPAGSGCTPAREPCRRR